MRMGFFYGPGTWFHFDGDVGKRVKKGEFPLIGNGEGVWNFIHVEDAANAVAHAVYIPPGAYNIVNNSPTKMKEWLPGFARSLKAPPPPKISEAEGEKTQGSDAVYYATKLRGASNEKIKAEFNYETKNFEWS